jgi:hypothetical protein
MMTCLQTLYGWKTAGLTTYFHNYIGIDHKTASAKLIKWWSENSTNTAIYIGNGSYKVNTDSDKNGIFQAKFLSD